METCLRGSFPLSWVPGVSRLPGRDGKGRKDSPFSHALQGPLAFLPRLNSSKSSREAEAGSSPAGRSAGTPSRPEAVRPFNSRPFWNALDGMFPSRFTPWFLGVADEGGGSPKTLAMEPFSLARRGSCTSGTWTPA